MISNILIILCVLLQYFIKYINCCKCYIPFNEPIEEVIINKLPHNFIRSTDLPKAFDWRSVNGTNYCNNVITQQNPAVCGSCWAEASTGALSDRYNIYTQGRLKITLAPQELLNFNDRITGGSCLGGDSLKSYEFIHRYGIADDTCAPFLGIEYPRGFTVAGMKDVEDVQAHQCFICTWSGNCAFVPKESFNLYSVDEFGSVLGEEQMMAEIYSRGPIACSINSEAPQFNLYNGGIISCNQGVQCRANYTDHVVVIAGWGIDQNTGIKYWVGRNSYGTQWGEGAGGGWFRLERSVDALNIESHQCHWAVPASNDIQRVIKQYEQSVGQ